MDELEIEPVVEQRVSEAVASANAILIVDSASYEEAATQFKKVKDVGALIQDKKEAITKPLNESLKAARALFKPLEDEQASAERIIKAKMIEYRNKVEAEARKKEEQLQRRAEKGTMKVATVIEKVAQIERVENTAGANYRKIKKMRIVDLKKVPAQYFVVDEVRLRRDALALGKLGEVIPGVEIYEETSLAG